jgi:hypothetical protein
MQQTHRSPYPDSFYYTVDDYFEPTERKGLFRRPVLQERVSRPIQAPTHANTLTERTEPLRTKFMLQHDEIPESTDDLLDMLYEDRSNSITLGAH